jgi:ABC-type transporter Mla subunit MlaD
MSNTKPCPTLLVTIAERLYESLLHRDPGMWDTFGLIEDAIAEATGETLVDVNKRLMELFRQKSQVIAEAKSGRDQLVALRTEYERTAKMVADCVIEANKQISALTAENATLKSAIGTPEVYAGVVTRILEEERDRAVRELSESRAERDRLRDAMNLILHGKLYTQNPEITETEIEKIINDALSPQPPSEPGKETINT